jgi:hypothetical protein
VEGATDHLLVKPSNPKPEIDFMKINQKNTFIGCYSVQGGLQGMTNLILEAKYANIKT